MANVRVDVTLVDVTTTTATLAAPNPSDWTADDARWFVWDVWRRLLAVGGESLQLRELPPYGTWRLEIVADTSAAVTGIRHRTDVCIP